MTVARLAISLDEDLARAVKEAAGDEPTSAWLAEAARQRLRAEGLAQVVAEWEAEAGALTSAELAAVRRREQDALGKRGRRRR